MGPSCASVPPLHPAEAAAAHEVPDSLVSASLLSPVLSPALTCQVIPVLALRSACCLLI